MSIQSVEALNYTNFMNYLQHIGSNSSSVSDFRKILNTASTQKTEKAETFVNAEQSLKELYPGLKYQVVDTSQFKYFNRLDFPISKLYGDTIDENTINELKSWKPTTPTATGHEPWVQRDLEKIPNGLHAVFIHPDVQKKMEQDPDYAKQITAKIQKYFDDDIRTNAAIDPESVLGMSQLVSITKDGEIGFHETVCDGPSSKKFEAPHSGTETQSSSKMQSLLKGMRNMPLSTALPLLENVQTTPFEYDYSYAYKIMGLNQRRKIESGEIV